MSYFSMYRSNVSIIPLVSLLFGWSVILNCMFFFLYEVSACVGWMLYLISVSICDIFVGHMWIIKPVPLICVPYLKPVNSHVFSLLFLYKSFSYCPILTSILQYKSKSMHVINFSPTFKGNTSCISNVFISNSLVSRVTNCCK